MGQDNGLSDRAVMDLWRRLVAIARYRGVHASDAEDLASEAVAKALDRYDESRGGFLPFCRAIHRNLLLNHWRDRKESIPFDPDVHDPRFTDELEDEVADMLEIIEEIRQDLTREEDEFLLALAAILSETEKAIVSEAARRVGHKPAEGWNIFRRIQRKAARHMKEYMQISCSLPAPEASRVDAHAHGEIHALARTLSYEAFQPRPTLAPARLSSLLFLTSGHKMAGYRKFIGSLTGDQRSRLARLVS